MAYNVKFLKGSSNDYQNLAIKDSNTFYHTTDADGQQRLYLGEMLLSDGADNTGAIANLDYADVAVAHQFITRVTQEDGQIAVERAALVADDIPALTLAKLTDAGTAAAADVLAGEIEAVKAGAELVSEAQVVKYVTDATAALMGATHYRGKYDDLANINFEPASGDIVIVKDKEYIYDGEAWEEIGDETIYVTKATTIAGVDLQNNITKEELLTALNVADGAQINILEGVQVNGTDLVIDGKKVNITVVTGETNGTIKVNDVEVPVAGLKSAAFVETSAFDAAGAAAAVQTNLDTEVQRAKEAEQANANAITALDEFVGDIPQGGTATTVIGYVNEKIAAEASARAEDKTTQAEKDKTQDDKITALELAVGTGGAVDNQINAKIAELDAEVSSTTPTEGQGLQVTVTEVDGKLTGVALIGNYDKKYEPIGKAQELIDGLDSPDTAITNQYVSQVVQTDGKITVTRVALPVYSVTEGATNGTIAVNGTDVAVHGLGSAAFTEAGAYEAAGEAAKVQAKLDTEVERAKAAEKANADAITKEATDRANAITAEEARANTYADEAEADAVKTANAYTDAALTWGTIA